MGWDELMTTARALADFSTELTLDRVPADVLDRARAMVLYDLCVGMAGYDSAGPMFDAARRFGAASSGSRLLVDGASVTAEWAAIANGSLIHARTQDDTAGGVGHLGTTILPSLLALGEERGSTGGEFLLAFIAGCEAMTSLGTALVAPMMDRGFRSTSVLGPLGAAVACARLLELGPDEAVHAIGIAASFGGGTAQTWLDGTQEWQCQVGFASVSGMTAARLASAGVSGSPNAIEGAAGLLAAFSGVDSSPELRLGQDWGVRTVSFKPYPICALNQTPVATVIELMSEESVVAGDVAQVTVELAPGAARYPGIDEHGPFQDVGSTLMSLPFCVALAALGGNVRHSDLTRFTDPDVAEMSRRVSVLGREDVARGACRVSVTTHSGETVTRQSGSPLELFAWDFEECVERVRQLAKAESLDEHAVSLLVETVRTLENRDVRELVGSTLS